MNTNWEHRCFRLSGTNDEDEFETHHSEYLGKQKDLVSEELTDTHANDLLDFVYDRNARKDSSDDDHLAASTARNYIRELRFVFKYVYDSDEFDDDYTQWDASKWNKIITRVSRDRGISGGTSRNTYYAARALVDWKEDAVADKSDIDAPKITHSKIDTEEVLDPEEVVSIIEETNNERDAAVFALMFECALRRTALCQLDIKHYKTDKFARVEVPNKEGVKTGQYRERPMNWAQGYLDRWLNHHPDRDNPEAPLFCSIREGRDAGKRLSSHAIYTMFKRTAERCDDIDSDRIHPHALRHARVTQLRKNPDLSKSDIETIAGWADSTPMHQRYSHVTSTEEAETTARRMGIEIEDDDEDQLIDECPRCGSDIPPGGRFCPTCTLRITDEPPEWFKLYRKIAPDEDPIMEKFHGKVSSIPRIDQLDIVDLDHLNNVFVLSWTGGGTEDTEEPYDQVQAVDDEDAERVNEIIQNQIRPRLISIKEEQPERLEMLSETVDLGNIEELEERSNSD